MQILVPPFPYLIRRRTNKVCAWSPRRCCQRWIGNESWAVGHSVYIRVKATVRFLVKYRTPAEYRSCGSSCRMLVRDMYGEVALLHRGDVGSQRSCGQLSKSWRGDVRTEATSLSSAYCVSSGIKLCRSSTVAHSFTDSQRVAQSPCM